ncbi:hypothetical protein M900_A0039 [Bacteriovorax sp. Seq25_V]|nr:hypothetical protein M900_A0039 [Bacteriovorax sp. Seq25_V]
MLQLAWGSDLHLFEDGVFNDDFSDEILEQYLKIDEKIHLLDRDVTYKGILGSGNTTMIVKVYDQSLEKEVALRLPHGNQAKNYNISDGKRFINYTAEGFKELEDFKLPIPKIYEYQKNSYLLVDLIDHDLDLKTFLARNDHYSEQEKSKMVNSLISFAKETALFESIGDFHLQQVVYSKSNDKWTLLDWSSRHQLARLPSSPKIFSDFLFTDNNKALDENGTELINTQGKFITREITDFEKEVAQNVNAAIEDQRRVQVEIDTQDLAAVKSKLELITDHKDILKVYQEMSPIHLASYFTLLQKDFITNQIDKFPQARITSTELEQLLNNLGKFTPYYFSQFSEKILASIEDLDGFMLLYKKFQIIGLDEEMEDDISMAIAKNIERILTNTYATAENLEIIKKLKGEFGVINYKSREILEKADEFLKPNQTCNQSVLGILKNTH